MDGAFDVVRLPGVQADWRLFVRNPFLQDGKVQAGLKYSILKSYKNWSLLLHNYFVSH